MEINSQEFKDNLARIACKQLKASEEFKQPRMNQIRELEDTLAYKLKPALQGRLNVPFDSVLLNGFVETLLSQVRNFPKIIRDDSKGSNQDAVRKVQAMYDFDTGPARGKWKKKDRTMKRFMAISNVGIYEIHSESDPKYRNVLNPIDYYDFHCEPMGGPNLEDHMFVGRTNIFKTEESLSSDLYDKNQVAKLKMAYQTPDFKFNEDLYRNKVNRYAGLGLDIETNNYVGERLYNMTEWEMEHNGTRYYLLFEYKTGIWVRCVPLKEVFESDLYSYVVANAQENPATIWGPGPLDQMKPIAEAIRINLNEILNNVRKRNWDMKAVDGRMFTDIGQLDWRQDGIAVANVPLGQTIQGGIYRFETPDISGSFSLVNYLNNFAGVNTAISDQTKGNSSQETLGIAKIDDLNMSKRMTLISDSYKEMYLDLALRYDWGLWEHCPEGTYLKVLGVDGLEMVELTKIDTEPDFEMSVLLEEENTRENVTMLEKRNAALMRVQEDPGMRALVNSKWLLENNLKVGGFKDEDIVMATSKDDYSSQMVSLANKAIERIISNKEPDENPDATTMFLEVINRYLTKHALDMKPKAKAKMEAYFDKHVEYAQMNAYRASIGAIPPEKGGLTPEVPVTEELPTEETLSV